MKLVDAEVSKADEGAPDIPRPPRPARRRVYTSLFFTLSVLIGTVAVIYWRFPNRQDELLTRVIEAHVKSSRVALEGPTGLEVRAWSRGIFDEPVPWPEVKGDIKALSATAHELFRKPLALVRYEVAGSPVSVAIWKARSVLPTVRSRTEDGLYAVAYRVGKFTSVAVGPATAKETWAPLVGAPL